MSILIASPFSLSAYDLVVVTVEAKNVLGYSIPSDENTSGAIV